MVTNIGSWKSLAKIICFLLLSTTVTACPCPVKRQRVPHIKGIVIKDGKPLADVLIQYVSLSCEGRDVIRVEAQGRTTTDGRFEISGKEKLGVLWIMPFPVNYGVCWQLRFREPGKNVICWEVDSSGPPDPPEFLELECNLNAKEVCRVISASQYFHNSFYEIQEWRKRLTNKPARRSEQTQNREKETH